MAARYHEAVPEPAPDNTPPVKRAHQHWWDPAWNRATWVLLAVFMIPIALGFYWLVSVAPRQSTIVPSTQLIAARLAEGGVQPFRGSQHTVYEATAALPSPDHPRSDGRLTLAWFSSTTCHECKKMDPFVWKTLQHDGGKFIVMEKDLGRQPVDARFGVSQPPEFVLISAHGEALARFGYQPNARALQNAIATALQSAQVGQE